MTDQTEKKPRASRRKKVEEQDTTVIELPAAVDELVPTESDAENRADADENEILELPVLPLRGTVVFPLTVVPLAAAQARSLRLIDEVMSGDRTVALVMQKDAELEGAGPDDVYGVGTISTIHQMMRVPDGTVRLAVQGNERMRILEFIQEEPYLVARVQRAPEIIEESVEVEALTRNTLELFQRLVSLVAHMPDELVTAALNVDDPRHLVYLVATNLRMDAEERQHLLEIDSVRDKLATLNTFILKELDVLELGKKIQSDVQEELGKNQREFYLREQLKAIQRELGEGSETEAEVTELRTKIEESGMPEEALKEARRELDRLSKLPPAAAEYGVIKTYLDWLTTLPWNTSTEGEIDVAKARQILNDEHYDLEKIKDRILEYLAVRKLKQAAAAEAGVEDSSLSREPILCFVGPPGVGKTSLAQSIAHALGRELTRMSLGGVRDEAEIRGHRRTYVGAMPGRIIQAIRRAGSNDPVFVLDEVDKLGSDWRGDPSSALLEVLDPEQNNTFSDHYVDVPYDLSKILFIATANQLEPIPAPLRDRMEIIELPGYTFDEKEHIARGHLIGKQLREHGISADMMEMTDKALAKVIVAYTREAGVRNLERRIADICRAVAVEVASGRTEKRVIDEKDVVDILGPEKFYNEVAERTEVSGVATGLAWTPAGGDILFIEATKMPGKGSLTLTGQLGDVMKESAQAALSYVRSKSQSLGLDANFLEKQDLHVHFPAGAIPKDGPSAGVTIVTALVSLLTGIHARGDTAMTREITLRGQVLPVGGIKEKVLAAHRAGIKRVVLPERNRKDVVDVPDQARQDLDFHFVSNLDEVLAATLERSPFAAAPAPSAEERSPAPEVRA